MERLLATSQVSVRGRVTVGHISLAAIFVLLCVALAPGPCSDADGVAWDDGPVTQWSRVPDAERNQSVAAMATASLAADLERAVQIADAGQAAVCPTTCSADIVVRNDVTAVCQLFTASPCVRPSAGASDWCGLSAASLRRGAALNTTTSAASGCAVVVGAAATAAVMAPLLIIKVRDTTGLPSRACLDVSAGDACHLLTPAHQRALSSPPEADDVFVGTSAVDGWAVSVVGARVGTATVTWVTSMTDVPRQRPTACSAIFGTGALAGYYIVLLLTALILAAGSLALWHVIAQQVARRCSNSKKLSAAQLATATTAAVPRSEVSKQADSDTQNSRQSMTQRVLRTSTEAMEATIAMEEQGAMSVMQMDESMLQFNSVGEAESRKPLQTSRGTAVYIACLGLAERLESDEDADQRAGSFLSDVASGAVIADGHVSFSTATEAVVTFNAVAPVLEHESRALSLIDALRRKDTMRTTVFAAVTDELVVNINPQVPTVLGPCMDHVRLLHRLQLALEIPVIAAEGFAFAAARDLAKRAVPVDIVELPGRPPETAFEILLHPFPGELPRLTEAVAYMSRCRFDLAHRALQGFKEDHWEVQRLRLRCKELQDGDKPPSGRYARRFVGWASIDAAAATAGAGDTNIFGPDAFAAGGGDSLGSLPNVSMDFDGVPVELASDKDGLFMRSDKVVGNVAGATQYGGMSETGTPVAILVIDTENEKHKQLVHDTHVHCRIASHLDHPGIVTVHTAALVNQRWLLVVEEYLPGGDLAWLLREFHPVPATATRRLAAELLNILRHLSHQEIVHGSIDWTTLRVGLDGTLKLVWFSTAVDMSSRGVQNLSTSRKAQRRAVSTCTAPELAQPPSIPHPNTDMYAFGVILLSLFCGTAVVSGDLALDAAVSRLETSVSEEAAGGGGELSDLVRRCITRYPEERISAAEAAFHRFFTA